MYAAQNQEVDPDARLEIVHDMLTLFHESAIYIPMFLGPDLQAYRTDTFEGWVRQPAEIGPVIFNNTSPGYVELRPIGADGRRFRHQLVALGWHRCRCDRDRGDLPGDAKSVLGRRPGVNI